MRYINSVLLGIVAAFGLVWLMIYLISSGGHPPPPNPIPKVDILSKVVLDKQDVPPPQTEREVRPPEPNPPPSADIDIEVPGTDSDFDFVPIGSEAPERPDAPVMTTRPGPPVLPQPTGPGRGPNIDLDYKHPVTYPIDALQEGLEGHVIIENVVDAKGNVIQVRIVEATDRTFIKAVKKSARLWKYGMSDQDERVHRTTVAFNLESSD